MTLNDLWQSIETADVSKPILVRSRGEGVSVVSVANKTRYCRYHQWQVMGGGDFLFDAMGFPVTVEPHEWMYIPE